VTPAPGHRGESSLQIQFEGISASVGIFTGFDMADRREIQIPRSGVLSAGKAPATGESDADTALSHALLLAVARCFATEPRSGLESKSLFGRPPLWTRASRGQKCDPSVQCACHDAHRIEENLGDEGSEAGGLSDRHFNEFNVTIGLPRKVNQLFHRAGERSLSLPRGAGRHGRNSMICADGLYFTAEKSLQPDGTLSRCGISETGSRLGTVSTETFQNRRQKF
jgi:hypothetical protein